MGGMTPPNCGRVTAHIRVWPQFRPTNVGEEEKISRPVSMSWWLSRPIQILLHQQAEETKNQNKN